MKSRSRTTLVAAVVIAVLATSTASHAYQKIDRSKPRKHRLARKPSSGLKRKPKSQETPSAPTKPKSVMPAQHLVDPLPKPGKVVERKTDEVHGVTSAWLENGVRVHYRYMDQQNGQVAASITLAGGEVEETRATKGVTQASAIVMTKGYTTKLSVAEIAQFMAGRDVKISASAAWGPFSIEFTAATDDFEAALEKIHVLLMDGKIPESAMEAVRSKSLRDLTMFNKVAHFHAVGALNDLISGGDPRRTLATESSINAQTLSQAQAWFDRLRKTAPIEVAIVGDIDLESALSLVERYLGSLPARKRKADHLDSLRHIKRPKGPLKRKVEFETPTSQVMLFDGFLTCDARNTQDLRALQVAALIVDERAKKKLRGQDNLAITISVKSESIWRYRDSDRMTAVTRCKPENAEKLAKAVKELFQDFADKPARKKEFDNANRQWLQYYRSGTWDNVEHWLRILQFHDLHGRDYTEEKDAWKIYKDLTPEKVRKVFKKYYTPQRQYTAYSMPIVAEVIKPKAQAPAKKP